MPDASDAFANRAPARRTLSEMHSDDMITGIARKKFSLFDDGG